MKSIIFNILTLLLSSFTLIAQDDSVTANGSLSVNGNRIVNEQQEVFSAAGNSMFWSGFSPDGAPFYRTDVVNHIAQNWNSGIIRAAMAVEEADGATVSPFSSSFPGAISVNQGGLGYINDPEGELERIKVIIDAAIANDIYVIVDFHSHFAHEFQEEAIVFFEEIARTYGDNDNIIYEIFNEPIDLAPNRANDPLFDRTTQEETWRTIIKPYAINVINAIRAIDPDNIIVVGTPGFSQAVDVASEDPIVEADLNLPAGAELNVAYTLHFYANEPSHPNLRPRATTAMNNGIALMVTEWGTVAASGDGAVNVEETLTWMEFLKTNNISHANWSISDKDEGASAIQRNRGVDGFLNDELTDSGNLVRCIVENWVIDEVNQEVYSFSSCAGEAEASEVVIIDSQEIPNGVGFKIEAERATQVNDNVSSKFDASDGVNENTFDGEGYLEGFSSGDFAAYSITGLDAGNYTVQLVVSSTTSGNEITLQRDSGTVNLGSIEVPNTGGDTNFQIITIENIPFSSDDNIAIGVTNGTGTFNVESFYLSNDSIIQNEPEEEGEVDEPEEVIVNQIVPIGEGFKIEAEEGTTLNNGIISRFDGSEGTVINTLDEEAFLEGFSTGDFSSYFIDGLNTANYIVQLVVSSTTSGNVLGLQRNSGLVDLGSVTIPNTGSNNNFQIVQIEPVSFSAEGDDISIVVLEGAGTFNVESFYLLQVPDILSIIEEEVQESEDPIEVSVIDEELEADPIDSEVIEEEEPEVIIVEDPIVIPIVEEELEADPIDSEVIEEEEPEVIIEDPVVIPIIEEELEVDLIDLEVIEEEEPEVVIVEDPEVLNILPTEPNLFILIDVFPNPVVDFVNVDFDGEIEYKIFDTNGRVLFPRNIYNGPINVSQLNAGIFFMQLYTSNRVKVFRLIKR